MTRSMSTPATCGQPTIHGLCTATCRFPDGQTRTLLASRFSSVDLFILAVRPPPLGTLVQVTLHPAGLAPLPPVEVRVVSTLLDPSEGKNCGFGAIIVSLDDDGLEAFHQALAVTGQLFACPLSTSRRPLFERRREPRVYTDLLGQVTCDGRTFTGHVTNLSMTGAMVELDAGAAAPDLDIDASLQLDIINEEAPEVISLIATVVRRTALCGQTGIGVQFVGMDDVVASRVEGLILRALWLTSLDESRK